MKWLTEHQEPGAGARRGQRRFPLWIAAMQWFAVFLAALILLPPGLPAQNIRVDSGTSLPANCTVGDEFIKTDASAGQKGYVCIADDTWEQQASVPTYVSSTRNVATSSPLTGGGDLSADRTIGCQTASGSQDGCLSSNDWATFNNKQAALTFNSPLSVSSNAVSCPSCEITGNKNAASGYAGLDTSSKLAASQLPNPSATTLGGIESLAASAHKWLNAISTSGVPAATQPDFSDLTGTASTIQIPDLSGTYQALSGKNAASGYAGLDASTKLAASQVPNPSATTLGGIESLAASAHKWLNAISTSGVPAATQPDFSDLTGSAACSQMPALTGNVTTSAGSCSTTIANSAVTNSMLASSAYRAMLSAYCTGTFTANTTVYMPGFGGSATTCTTTTATGGAPMTGTWTLKNLQVKAGSAGKNGSSGAVTIVNGGVATAVTCTVGTGTSCSDTSHTAAVSSGNVITISVGTVPSETLANASVSFELWN